MRILISTPNLPSYVVILATTMELFDSEQERWRHFADLPNPMSDYAVCINQGKVYLTGNDNLYICPLN